MTLLGLLFGIFCLVFFTVAIAGLCYADKRNVDRYNEEIDFTSLKPIHFVKSFGWILLICVVIASFVGIGFFLDSVKVF